MLPPFQECLKVLLSPQCPWIWMDGRVLYTWSNHRDLVQHKELHKMPQRGSHYNKEALRHPFKSNNPPAQKKTPRLPGPLIWKLGPRIFLLRNPLCFSNPKGNKSSLSVWVCGSWIHHKQPTPQPPSRPKISHIPHYWEPLTWCWRTESPDREEWGLIPAIPALDQCWSNY